MHDASYSDYHQEDCLSPVLPMEALDFSLGL